MTLIQTAVHTVGVALFGYSLYYDLLYVHPSPELLAEKKRFQVAKLWPGKWKYLTIWNVVLQLAYHVIALLNDLVGSSELNTKRQTFLQKLRDGYFASWVFPTGMFVCVAFWVLCFVDKGMIDQPEYVPHWYNHVLHTVPLLHVLMESFFFLHSHQSSPLTFGMLLFGYSCYVVWIVWVNQINNAWPYPVLEILGPMERAIFIAAGGLTLFSFYFLGEALIKWRWGEVTHSKSKGKSKGR